MASVKVAVRVRPLNQREINMNSLPIIEMDGKKTRICNKVVVAKHEGEALREKYKDFTFDYSYWSFDSNDSHFATQEQVFNDLGTDVVENVFTGYNYCVFAYGQTGSGKTHTMMGSQTSPEGPGLIPRICQSMFNRMNEGKQSGTTYRVEVSYLEIYNERVKDLLKKTSANSHSLKVREHPKHGPYVEDLSKHLVMDYNDIISVMNRGNITRTTASTNMNDVSSRSHAIFTMTFSQAGFIEGMPSETVSKVHLVDLAGSERADASGATGQRLKEGAHINKSLVTLGSVISALADMSERSESHRNSQKPTFIPYRDSTLTWLLKDSLGGNAKTIMIATISPADCNYGETLSTLRYANRAKNIINKPTINEDINVKLIKELRAEISKLKLLLTSNIDNKGFTPEVLAELHKKEAKEKSLTEEWTEKWKETQKILMEQKDLALRKTGTGVVLDSQKPHLIRIDDDLTSTGITLYHLKEGETKIGSEEGSHIVLHGLETHHCSITLEAGCSTLIPFGGAVCRVNSQVVNCPTKLSQGCAIRLGETTMFRYNDPVEAAKLRREGNLSRNSFLSRSATDLAWSTEFNSTIAEEETKQLEEKRKQLELEEARLQKESQELLQEKAQLELQKNTYKQRQQETEEAWKAEQLNRTSELSKAQLVLEQNRQKFELEYAAHKRRLAEDYKRLDHDEQETLATLHLKEADLKKRREYLDWEVEQEMEQMEVESAKIEQLKANLQQKSKEVEAQVAKFSKQLQEKLDKPDEDFKAVLAMEDTDFSKYLEKQEQLINDWKDTVLSSLNKDKQNLVEKLKDVTAKINSCDDPQMLEQFQAESTALNKYLEDVSKEFSNVEQLYQSKKESLTVLPEYRTVIKVQNQECCDINNEIESSIKNLQTHEKKITKIESDLSLIASQEKLIVGQLVHIGNSKQKLLSIIENSTEGLDLGAEILDPKISGIKNDELLGSPMYRSRESSPNRLTKRNDYDTLKINDLSPIKAPSEHFQNEAISASNSPVVKHASGANIDNITNLNLLIEQFTAQKAVLVDCLENDCDKDELSTHLRILQELRNRYLELEGTFDVNLRQKWLSLDDDDSTFDFDKTGDGTSYGESDLDESEIQSSADQDDQLQVLVEEGVERRLREILNQLKSGEKPNLLRQYGLSHKLFQRSLPCGLNNDGGTETDEGSTESLHLPRSRSMSGNWLGDNCNIKEGVLPGILDIKIPRFVERGSGTKAHIKFEIVIMTMSEKWVILRRYKQFRELRKFMSSKYGTKVSKLPFPSRRIFSRLESTAKERRGPLEAFLQNLIKVCFTMPTSPMYNTNPIKIKQSLLSFSQFFEKGVFDSTKYGTS